MNSKTDYPTRASLLLGFLKGSKLIFFISMCFAALCAALDLFMPKIIAFTVDSILIGSSYEIPAILDKLIAFAGGIAYIREHMYLIAILICVVALLRMLTSYLFKNLSNGNSFLIYREDETGLRSAAINKYPVAKSDFRSQTKRHSYTVA